MQGAPPLAPPPSHRPCHAALPRAAPPPRRTPQPPTLLRNRHPEQTFTEECYSIAFHPSGLHVLCGFSDKLRLMNLLMDDIRPYKVRVRVS